MRVSSRLAGRRARVTGFSALRPGLGRPSLPAPEPPAPGDSPPSSLPSSPPRPAPRCVSQPSRQPPHPLISGRSLSGDFHPGVGGAVGQRSGWRAGSAATCPPAAPPELASDSAAAAVEEHWFGGRRVLRGFRVAAPAAEDRRETKPLRAREPPLPRGTGSGLAPQRPRRPAGARVT